MCVLTEKKNPVSILTYGGGANYWRSVIESASSSFVVTSCKDRRTMCDAYSGVTVLVSHQFPDRLLDRLPDLRWIQCLSVGVDALIDNPKIPDSVSITNTRGLYGDAVAEYSIWAMITLFRGFHRVIANQNKRRWEQIFGHGLADKHIGIVGLGDVGKNIAQLARAHSMQVTGFVRDPGAVMPSDTVDFVVSAEQLAEVVPDLDVLILSVPLTNQTRGMVNRNLISKMNPAAIIINVSRAALIDGSAVSDAVANGQIAGAALDVFEKEPLPRWSGLWKTPNLIVTPHTSSMSAEYKTRIAELLTENVLRFTSGRPLLNVVDRSKGY